VTGNNQYKDLGMKPPLPRTLSAVPQTLHTRLEIAKAIRALAGPDEDELLRQRRTEIAAIRRDLEALSRDLHKAFETAATLAKAELRAALKKTGKVAFLKASADDPAHPGWPAGTSGGRGGKFRPKDADGGETSSILSSEGSAQPRVQLVNDIPPRVGLAASLQRLIAMGRLTEKEAAAIQRDADAMAEFDKARVMAAIESMTVSEAQSVLSSEEFAQIRAAYLAGRGTVVQIGGRTIQYEPDFPLNYPAMTDFKGNGFALGPGAFTTPLETEKTVLHELYRLNTTIAGVPGAEISGESALVEGKAVHDFVERIIQSGVMDR
jgi:hypothetical protein